MSYKCDYCFHPFPRKDSRDRHMRTACPKGRSEYKAILGVFCHENCGQEFHSQSELDFHKQKCDVKSRCEQCLFCNKKIQTSNMPKHLRYQCNYADPMLRYAEQLTFTDLLARTNIDEEWLLHKGHFRNESASYVFYQCFIVNDGQLAKQFIAVTLIKGLILDFKCFLPHHKTNPILFPEFLPSLGVSPLFEYGNPLQSKVDVRTKDEIVKEFYSRPVYTLTDFLIKVKTTYYPLSESKTIPNKKEDKREKNGLMYNYILFMMNGKDIAIQKNLPLKNQQLDDYLATLFQTISTTEVNPSPHIEIDPRDFDYDFEVIGGLCDFLISSIQKGPNWQDNVEETIVNSFQSMKKKDAYESIRKNILKWCEHDRKNKQVETDLLKSDKNMLYAYGKSDVFLWQLANLLRFVIFAETSSRPIHPVLAKLIHDKDQIELQTLAEEEKI